MCAEDFKVKNVQFTLDLIDPWWPSTKRNQLASAYKEAMERNGVKIASVFGGVASYTYAQLLAPTQIQREISFQFFKRAIDLTVELGADVFGTPIGGMSNEDVNSAVSSAVLYESALSSLRALSRYGKEKGLHEIHIEATPLISEFLYTPQAAKKFMQDLDGTTAIPIRLLIDWGHALFHQIPDTKADMAYWLKECSTYVKGIHLQQTDGLWDRHWDFTKDGLVNAELIKTTTENAGLTDIVQYLEVVTIFEDSDEQVYQSMKKTMRILHEIFDEES